MTPPNARRRPGGGGAAQIIGRDQHDEGNDTTSSRRLRSVPPDGERTAKVARSRRCLPRDLARPEFVAARLTEARQSLADIHDRHAARGWCK